MPKVSADPRSPEAIAQANAVHDSMKAPVPQNVALEAVPQLGSIGALDRDPWSKVKKTFIHPELNNTDKKGDQYICVNGRPVLCQRGRDVAVADPYAAVLEYSKREDEATMRLQQAYEAAYNGGENVREGVLRNIRR